MSLGEVLLRTCPNCGEVNRRATGFRAIWTNPRYTARQCQACAHPLDGSAASVFDRLAGAGLRATFYGFNALSWCVVAIVATVIVDASITAPVPRLVYPVLAAAGVAFGLYRADITRRRKRILAVRSG
ncbi:hypothetical protein DSM104443_02462 [Usitatibacter rugosus]|uniref:Uncharacterized protein n=1 Tax=Usitatibacter rugosus TaxID=2732067 RepID=A0A6M4H0Q7_9PROT|nr:hypothetical protein [Usitatibacter rugosus]QJR11387.1 hypothetical protein DSM104443_02462 [Usitatibacter rugosus]